MITTKKDGDKSDNSNVVMNDDGTMYVAGDEGDE